MLVSTAGNLNAYGLTSDGSGGVVEIVSPGNLEMSGTIISGGVARLSFNAEGNISEREVDFSISERSNVSIQATGQVYIGRTEVNSAGASVQTGSSIRTNGDVVIVGGQHNSGTAFYLEGAGEVVTIANDGMIRFQSGQDAQIEGLILAGGTIKNIYDSNGIYLGRDVVQNVSDATLTIEAADQVSVGGQLRAGA